MNTVSLLTTFRIGLCFLSWCQQGADQRPVPWFSLVLDPVQYPSSNYDVIQRYPSLKWLKSPQQQEAQHQLTCSKCMTGASLFGRTYPGIDDARGIESVAQKKSLPLVPYVWKRSRERRIDDFPHAAEKTLLVFGGVHVRNHHMERLSWVRNNWKDMLLVRFLLDRECIYR